MECPITSGRDLAEGYVAGTLSEAEHVKKCCSNASCSASDRVPAT